MEDTTLQYAQQYLEEGDAWNPKEKKRTTALRSEGFLENSGIDQDEWEEEQVDIRPTHQNSRMRRIAQRRKLNERVDDDVPNSEELFHDQVLTGTRPDMGGNSTGWEQTGSTISCW